MEKIIATDAVIEKDGELLLIRRGRSVFIGKLALPGGRVDVDDGESVEKAVVREALEETGLQVKPREILGVYSGGPSKGRSIAEGIAASEVLDPRGWAITTVFICDIIGGTAKAGDDADEILWVKPEEVDLSQVAFKHHPKIIKDYLKWKKKKSGTFWMGKQ